MATFTKGILGGFSGTVGTVVGATWKGISYMRSKAAKRSKAPTQVQLNQRLKFTVAMKFLQPLTGLLSLSFKNFAVKMSGINSACSYTLKHAITGTFPDYKIDYSIALVSRGDLPNAGNPQAAATGNNGIKFSWNNNSNTGKAKDKDKAILVVYCPDLQQFLYTTGSAPRSDGTETLDASPFSGKAVETYIAFISEDQSDVSNSFYTGNITVS